MLGISPGALRTTVSRVRRILGDSAIAGSQGRYELALATDAELFTRTLSELGPEQALELWTGLPFDEFATEDWAAPEVGRLTELHASAVEDRATALIADRRWAEAIAELRAHVAVHPLRDTPRGLLLHALAGAGRQADALQAFREYRAYLAEEVGTEPSAEVRRIDQRVASGWDGTEEPAPSQAWLPLPAELAQGPTLIGRRREITQLASDLALVSGAGSRTVVLEGEAGIGKTTLLVAFARTLQQRGSAAVLYGRCQGGPAGPLEPFRSLVEHLVDHVPVDVLQTHVARCAGQLARIAPRMTGRVDFPATALGEEIVERHLLFEAIGDLLSRVAALGPLVVLLDDLQWAEPTALELLRHLVRTGGDAPVRSRGPAWRVPAPDSRGCRTAPSPGRRSAGRRRGR